MDWLKAFQRSLDFIEEHLTEPLRVKDIAEEMNISEFYYRKIFGVICGFTVGEYIRNRRLTLAGCELSRGGRVTDIALKYGYNTPEGFARAFAAFHGITPIEAKRGGRVRTFGRVCVKISVKGGNIMEHRIIKESGFKVAEKRMECPVDTGNDDQNRLIPDFWDKCREDGTVSKLLELSCGRKYIFGICYAHTEEKSQTFTYSIAARLPDGDTAVPDGFTVTEIPARRWAEFECTGAMPMAIRKLWHSICTEFFPSSSYEPTYEMDIEVYPEGDMTDEGYKSMIRVPVKG
ncbi:MAG: AraC family transcriptional regulator [Ruminococcus sp.]|nr:AraC family transcriptional regulator [Ruminococcus sp.]